MKKLSIIVILSIIFNLLIIPYGFVNAEPEPEPEPDSDPVPVADPTPTTDPTPTVDPAPTPDSEPASTSNQNSDSDSDSTQTQNSDSDSSSTQESNSSSTSTSNQRNSGGESSTSKKTTTSKENRKSSNANLSDLGITPNDFKGFKPSTYNYSVTVPNDVESISVYAKVQDAKAQITSGTGNHKLDVGTNDIQVIVTAENGNTQTYTINITREESEKTETTTQEVSNNSDLKKLEIKGYKLTPSFSADVYEYKLDVNKDVNNLDIITEGLNDKVNIEIAGNTDLKER